MEFDQLIFDCDGLSQCSRKTGLALLHKKFPKLHTFFHGIFKEITGAFSRTLLDYSGISRKNKTVDES